MKRLRTLWRLGRVAVHLGYGVGVATAVFPLVSLERRRRLKQRWSRQLVGMLGIRLEIAGPAQPLRGLVVANHISWVDVFVINAVHPVAFVAKDEVLEWPVIGWLAERNDTVFLARGSRRAAHAMGQQVADMLAGDVAVGVFPEGTTSEGDGVLPFRGALLQGAIDAGMPVQPLALRYSVGGRRSVDAAYCGETSLLTSLWRTANASRLTVICARLDPIEAGACRRELASRCAGAIGAALGSAEQHEAPGRDDVRQRKEHGGAADVLGALGETVMLQRDAIDGGLDGRVDQLDYQHQ
jgi:1-acyl-sn-glycerol-3-phosphate acyltransferase